MAGSYELYAEVLRRAAVKATAEIGWELEPSRAQFLPDSIADWQPFRESNAAMDRLKAEVRRRDHLQHRRQAARHLAPPPAHRARPRRHRPAGPQLQARAGPLQGVRPPDRQEEGLGPHHQRPLHRRRAAAEDARPGDLGQPSRPKLDRAAEEADGRGQDLPRRDQAPGLLEARGLRRRLMELLDPDDGPDCGSRRSSKPSCREREAERERPHVFTNFAVTVDGHATIDGRSGPIGSAADTRAPDGPPRGCRRGDDRRRHDSASSATAALFRAPSGESGASRRGLAADPLRCWSPGR